MKLHLHNIAGYLIARGDLIQGGMKQLAIEPVLQNIAEDTVVCAGHEYGHSVLALAYAALATDKNSVFFFAGAQTDTYVLAELMALPNVTCHFLSDCSSQQAADAHAERYAKEHGFYHVPLGFDFPAFRKAYIKLMRDTWDGQGEVWIMVGSGTTWKCAQKAWPHATIRTVNLGFKEFNTDFLVTEGANQVAERMPPWRAAMFYDAKGYQFIQEHVAPGSLIWVIA